MEFRVLRASNPRERDQWEQLWRRLPAERQDVYFLPGYVFASEAEGYGEACCAVAEDGEAAWLYPFLRTPFDSKGEISISGNLCDIQTPYGYGGPVVTTAGEDPAFLRTVWEQWSAWSAEASVVGEFVRFHPLLQNQQWAPQAMGLSVDRQTVVMQLDHYPQLIWTDPYFRRHRNMIRAAERSGCTFEVRPAKGQMRQFATLYNQTHQRVGGTEGTQFGQAYFETLVETLGPHSWLGLIHARGDLIVAVLVLEGQHYAHSHLMGDKRLDGVTGMANLVYHEIALEASRRGLRALHMGGGRSGDPLDSLLRFKVSLSPHRLLYYVGKRCHNEDAYETLALTWERRHGPRPQGYFLFYRLSGPVRR